MNEGEKKEEKEKRGGAAALPSGGGGAGPQWSAGPALHGRPVGWVTRLFAGGSRLSGSGAGGLLPSALRAPLLLGLIVGASAVLGGYGIVALMGEGGGEFSGVGVRLPRAEEDGPLAGPAPRGDSLAQFVRANKGGLAGAEGASGSGAADGDGEAGVGAEDEGDGEQTGAPGGNPLASQINAALAGSGEAAVAGKDPAKKDGWAKLSDIRGASPQTKAFLPDSPASRAARGGAGAAPGAGGGAGGSLSAARGTRTVMGRSRPGGRGPAVQGVMGQLRNADSFSRSAAGQPGDSARYTAAKAFDAPAPGAGASAGGGAGAGPEGGAGGAGSDAVPLGSGAPLRNPENGDPGDGNTCGEGEVPAKDGCRKLDEINLTPWQRMLDAAVWLLAAAATLYFAAWLLDKLGFIGMATARGLARVAGALGGTVALLGMGMMAFGQALQGTIFTLAGSVLAALGFSYGSEGHRAEQKVKGATAPLERQGGAKAATDIIET